MNKKIWKQGDSRWASKPYPVKSSSFGGNGCGCCACVHVAMEQDRYKDWTPESLRPWMVKQGFAIRGQGTTWNGITETLKHIGHSVVVRVWSDPMSVAFKELNKGNRIGIILFNGNKAPNGTRWTAGGHYVAFTDYKVENGLHMFYCKDSGGRDHDGWYSYEKSMKGCVAKVWIVERLGKQATTPKETTYKPTTPYTGSLPSGTVKNGTNGSDAKAVQTFLNWCINAGLEVDSWAGAKTEAAIKAYQKTYGLTADGIFGPKSKAKAAEIVNSMKPPNEPSKPATTGMPSGTHTVIDVSEFQSAIDWAKVKKAGAKGVIVRCGYRGAQTAKLNPDDMFMKHITGAAKAGLALGVYFFTQAITEAEGREEARYTLEQIKKAGVTLAYPIAVDSENVFYTDKGKRHPGRANDTQLSKAKRTKAIKGFCDEIQKTGAKAMIYASTSWLNNQLDMSKLPFVVWCAQYYKKCEYKGSYLLWQYTSTGKVDGVKGNADMNHCYN